MIEIALRFGWLAQSIVLVSTVILVIYIITSENWNTQSNTHHRETPNEAIKRYILDFNSKKEMDGYFQFPIMVLNNGKKSIHEKISTFINFEGIAKTGWEYSFVNSMDTVSELNNTAIVRLNFSRLNKSNEKYLRANADYTLIKENNKWLISSVIIDSDVPMGV